MLVDIKLAISLCLWVSLPALAQDFRITGHVTDASRAALASVIVTATNVDSGSTHEVLSTSQGYFQFARLPPGSYRLEALKPGYRLLSRTEVSPATGRAATVELQMEGAQVSETVTLEARQTAAGFLLAYLCNVSPGSGCEMLDSADASFDATAVKFLLP
jgi:hypothetical protein